MIFLMELSNNNQEKMKKKRLGIASTTGKIYNLCSKCPILGTIINSIPKKLCAIIILFLIGQERQFVDNNFLGKKIWLC